MKKHLYLLSLVFICACKKDAPLSKTFTDGFFKQIPAAGSSSNMVYDATGDAIYVSGGTSASSNAGQALNFSDWTTNSRGRDDGYLMKYKTDGTLIWSKLLGGNSGDRIAEIGIDNAQNVYATGIFGGTANFDGTELKAFTSYVNDQTLFIAKYTKDGNQQWVKKVTNAGILYAVSMAIDNINNKLYVTGSFNGSVTIGDATYKKDGFGIFIAAYTLDGNLQWAKTYGEKQNQINSNQIKTFKDGSLLLVGTSQNGQTIEGKNLDGGTFFAHLDPAGSVMWAKSLSGGSDYPRGLIIDENNNFYLSTAYSGILKIGDKTLTSNNRNSILAKYDQTGNLIWVSPLSGSSIIELSDIYYQNNKIYTSGYYYKDADFGGIKIPAGNDNTQGFTARYSADGKCESAANLESTGGYPHKILTVNGSTFLYGHFETSYIFQGVKFSSPNGANGYFMKFKTP